MADEVFGQLDTSKVAKGFNDFLESQGLGEMNPTSAARFRNGVEVSPMDEILAMNGFDIDSLFSKILPEPPLLVNLDSNGGEAASQTRSDESVKNAEAAVKSLGLSSEELATLSSLLTQGGSASVGTLPAPIFQLLFNNPGVSNAQELLLQLGELYELLNGLQPPNGKDIAELMLSLMSELKTDDSRLLLSHLKNNPLATKDIFLDSITGFITPLGATTALLRARSSFDFDPIIGSIADETLVANRAGSSRLTGVGGADLFVIALRSDPFASPVSITDFNQDSGSKIVLDTNDYGSVFNPIYRVAKNGNTLKMLSKTNTTLIFNRKSSELLLNANKKAKGYGPDGGTIATFENDAVLDSNDILVFNGGSLFYINKNTYIP